MAEAFIKEALEEAGVAREVAEESFVNLKQEVKENLANTIKNEVSAVNLLKGVPLDDAESITEGLTTIADRTVADAEQKAVVESDDLATAINRAAANASELGKAGLKKIGDYLKTNTDKLISALKKPSSVAQAGFKYLSENFGKFVLGGCTIAVVVVWLASGGGIQDLINAIGSLLSDLGKSLIGALAGVAESLVGPLGAGAGSAIKTVGIIIGAIAGVILLAVGIYFIVKKVREDKEKQQKLS